jgi:hypothetical protein
VSVPPNQLVPQPIRDDAGLRAWRLPGETRRLVVCFSGIGRGGADAPPPPEFQRLAGRAPRDHLLFIADPARTWLNREGIIDEIKALIESEAAGIDATQICTLGHSLGGYTALVMPAFTKVNVAIALSPQYAVDPGVVPTETRWADLRAAIPAFRIANVEDHIRDTGQYFVFFGRHPREKVQRYLAQPHANLDLYILPRTHHNTPQKMKEAGVLDSVLDACLNLNRRFVEKTIARALNGRKIAAAVAVPA